MRLLDITYEAFAHVVDSMFNQHAKWLDVCRNHVPWRRSVSSLNILLSSLVWRQDHNGFSHQDPGYVDLVTNNSPNVLRVYFRLTPIACYRWPTTAPAAWIASIIFTAIPG